MPRQPAQIEWPTGGLNRQFAYQSQAPFTTPSALNVRSYVGGGERRRGGSRPGTEKAFAQELGSGNPVNLLGEISFVSTTLQNRLLAASNGVLSMQNGSGAMASVSSTLDLSTAPLQAANYLQKAYIADYDTAGPVISRSDGIISGTSLTTGATVNLETAGAEVGMMVMLLGETAAQNEVVTITLTGTPSSGTWTPAITWMRPTGNADGSNELVTETLSAVAYNADGAALELVLEAGQAIGSGNWTVTGSAGGPYTATFTSALAGKNIADLFGGFAYLTVAASTLNSTTIPQVQIDRTVIGGADMTRGTAKITAVSGTTVTIGDYQGTNSPGGNLRFQVFRSPKVFDPVAGTLSVWETETYFEPLPPYQQTSDREKNRLSVLGITQTIASSQPGSYKLVQWDGGTNTSKGGLQSTKLKRYRRGDVPVGCTAIGQWMRRLVMTGSPLAPHAVFFSREGNPLDFDYGRDDAQAAFVAAGPQAGELGEPGVAIMPHSHSCLIIGCQGSCYVISQNPMQGGRIRLLSPTVGIVGSRAWCHAPDLGGSGQVLVFLGSDGLYAITGECGSPPVSLSREKLPEALLGVDPTTHWVSMAYDPRFRGIYVQIQPISDEGTATEFWFDWEAMAFWPESRPLAQRACSLLQRKFYSGTDSPVIFGCNDGYLRRAAAGVSTDDGTAISWHVDMGPIQLGRNALEDGLLSELTLEMGASSGAMTWAIRSGDNAEAAYLSGTTRDSGSHSAGVSYTRYPRVRGGAAVIRLSGSGGRCQFETMLIGRQAGGRRRI